MHWDVSFDGRLNILDDTYSNKGNIANNDLKMEHDTWHSTCVLRFVLFCKLYVFCFDHF